ncbi:MAG: TlpA family protein disulfide reductase [Bacteroidota bacterium]
MKNFLIILACCLTLPLQAAEFTPLDRTTARQLLDPQSHSQPTVVALWSSDCSHCRKNLELLAKLSRSNKRLQVITIAAEPETAALAPILDRYRLPGARYAYGNGNPDAIAYAIDPTWAGELPRSFLFDGIGGKEKISGVISKPAAEKALGVKL